MYLIHFMYNFKQTNKGRGKKKEKDEPKIKKDYDPDDPDKPYGCECEFCTLMFIQNTSTYIEEFKIATEL